MKYCLISINSCIITIMDPILRNKLNILIHLAGVDGHFDRSERAFIYNICLRHNIELDRIGDLIEEPEPIMDLDHISYETAIDYLTDSILLMLVDGKVLPSEVLFCLDMGERLGFNRESVDALIKGIQEESSTSYGEMKKLIQKLEHHSL